MLIDMHAHSSGISHCCQIPYPQVLEEAKKTGLSGIVLTNHYTRLYCKDRTVEAFVEDYIKEYEAAKAYGEQIDCKVFFGIEVTMEWDTSVHMLVYGIEPETLRKQPFLFDMPLQELYRTVKEFGGALVQAHPFRNGGKVLDINHLDGVEINCHPLYGNTYSAELLAVAKETGMAVTCGGDYHADTYRPHCGVYLPEHIKTTGEIADFLINTQEIRLCIQQLDPQRIEERVYLKK